MKFTIKAILISTFAAAFATTGLGAERTTARACTSTPAEVVAAVYAQLEQDKDLAPQISHINIQFTNYDENGDNGAIKLQGWADSQKDYDNVVEAASGTSCVSRVNEQAFFTPKPENLAPGGACDPPATKACGDICIPGGETCNIGKSGGE